MYLYDVETFMCACDRKGLAAKTMKSYEQTLRLFGQLLSVREIERTEEASRSPAGEVRGTDRVCCRRASASSTPSRPADILRLNVLA